MYKQESDNSLVPFFLKYIRILFSDLHSNPRCDIIDDDDIDTLLPNFKTGKQELKAYKIERHSTTASILVHYVTEIQRLIKSGVVEINEKKLKTFLADIVCNANVTEVKFMQIDENVYNLWKRDKDIVTGFNQQSIVLMKYFINNLCLTREMACESEMNLKYLFEKYIEEETRQKIFKEVCFVERETENVSMGEKLMREICNLELEDMVSRLKEFENKLNTLFSENQRLDDKNLWINSKINKNELLSDCNGFDEIIKRKKLKQILNDLEKEYLKFETHLKEKDMGNLRLFKEVISLEGQLDSKKITNSRVLIDMNLDMICAKKINKFGENSLAEAIDLGAELLEDISKIGDQLTKTGIKMREFTTSAPSKDGYFVNCIMVGRQFINALFIQFRILMDTMSKFEDSLSADSESSKIRTAEVLNLKREKTELKEEIISEKLKLEEIIKTPENSSKNANELLKRSEKYPTRDNKQVMKLHKMNYELSEKLVEAETSCENLVLKLENAENETDNLKVTIKKQEEMLKENQRIIDQLKNENVKLKTRNDDLTGSLIASMVLLFCTKKIVTNWIKDNEAKHT